MHILFVSSININILWNILVQYFLIPGLDSNHNAYFDIKNNQKYKTVTQNSIYISYVLKEPHIYNNVKKNSFNVLNVQTDFQFILY